MKITKKTLIIVCVIFILIGIAISPTVMWHGGFRQAEYRIRLQTESGDIIKHALIYVTKPDGSPADKYPILQFESNNPIESEEDGTFVFHQIRSGSQFGGKFTSLFGLFPIGRKGPPSYKIMFHDGSSEIFSVDFASLDDGFDYSTASRVNRTFTHEESIPPHQRDNTRQELLGEIAIDIDFPVIERVFTIRNN